MSPGNCSGSYSEPPRARAIALRSSSCPREVDATTFSIRKLAMGTSMAGIARTGAVGGHCTQVVPYMFLLRTRPPREPKADFGLLAGHWIADPADRYVSMRSTRPFASAHRSRRRKAWVSAPWSEITSPPWYAVPVGVTSQVWRTADRKLDPDPGGRTAMPAVSRPRIRVWDRIPTGTRRRT